MCVCVGGGGVVWLCGKREIIYLSLHCHHQNDIYIMMGNDKGYFYVSLTVRGKVTDKTVSTDHNLFEEKREPTCCCCHKLNIVSNQHTRELISARITSHKYNNKDPSRLR